MRLSTKGAKYPGISEKRIDHIVSLQDLETKTPRFIDHVGDKCKHDIEYGNELTQWHVEIPVYNVENAKKFYTAVQEWEFNPAAFTDSVPGVRAMHLFNKGDVLHGCLNHMQDGKAIRNHHEQDPEAVPVLPTFEVADCDEILQKVTSNEGKVQWPKTMIGHDMGYYARFIDPEGNMLGLWSAK